MTTPRQTETAKKNAPVPIEARDGFAADSPEGDDGTANLQADLDRFRDLALRSQAPNADALRLFNQEQVPSFDLRPELAQIAAPTLVIAGEEDFITGPLSAAELSEIAGAETVLIPGCGHFIFVEAPEAFRDSVLAFLGAGARA